MPIPFIPESEAGCRQILNTPHTQASFEALFGLEDDYAPHDIDKAYKRLALKFHPDKLPHTGLATQVMQRLNEMRNALLTGRFSPQPYHHSSPISEWSTTELLNCIERKSGDIPCCISELKKRIQSNKNSLFVTSDSGNTSLYLAVSLGHVNFFNWLLEQKADPHALLAFCSARQNYNAVTAAIFFHSVPDPLSAYFMSAVLDKFPTLKENIKHPGNEKLVFKSYAMVSLHRGYQACILGSIGLLATAAACAIAFPFIAIQGGAIGLMVALGLFIGIALHCLYGECRKWYEKNKMDSILVSKNFFKPTRDFPFSFYDDKNSLSDTETKGIGC